MDNSSGKPISNEALEVRDEPSDVRFQRSSHTKQDYSTSLTQECSVRDSYLSNPVSSSRPETVSKTERKQALNRATFYSECLLQGIQPRIADRAALDVRAFFEKWWESTKFRPEHSSTLDRKQLGNTESDNKTCEIQNLVDREDNQDGPHPRKKRKIQDSLGSPRNLSTSMPLSELKHRLVRELKKTRGDTSNAQIHSLVETLGDLYIKKGIDQRWTASDGTNALQIDGTWLALSKSIFSECKGRNQKGDGVFSLGRLAFDMFQPTGLSCSLQGVFNLIRPWTRKEARSIVFPSSLHASRQEPASQSKQVHLRNYDLVFTLTIEPNQTRSGEAACHSSTIKSDNRQYVIRRPIRCLLTNHGYCLPDPEVANRLTIWFTGGSLEVEDEDKDLGEWKRLFNPEMFSSHSTLDSARSLAARMMTGAHRPDCMHEDGTMEYFLKRPIGGHGKVFIDVIYADNTLRILRGHQGSLFVFTKVPST